jgi:S1-C subfamily serine protease
MRAVPRAGVEVLGVDPRSRADRAGIKPGDLITVFGPVRTPTPAQVTRTFDALSATDRILVAVTRGDSHHIVVVGTNAR